MRLCDWRCEWDGDWIDDKPNMDGNGDLTLSDDILLHECRVPARFKSATRKSASAK